MSTHIIKCDSADEAEDFLDMYYFEYDPDAPPAWWDDFDIVELELPDGSKFQLAQAGNDYDENIHDFRATELRRKFEKNGGR